MKLIIVHDNIGKIRGIGEIDPQDQSPAARTGVIPAPGQFVLELEKETQLPNKSLAEIAREHRVDVTSKKLVRRDGHRQRPP